MFALKRFSVNFLISHVASRDWMTDVKVAEDGFDPATCRDIAKQLVSILDIGYCQTVNEYVGYWILPKSW